MKQITMAAVVALMLLTSAARRRPTSRSCSRATASCMSAARPCAVDGHEYLYGQMYVEIRIPAQADASLSDHHGAWRLDVRHQLHRHARTAAKAGRSISSARATPSMWSTSRAAAAPASSPPRTGRCTTPRATTRRRASSRRKSSSCGRRPRCTPNGPATARPTIRRPSQLAMSQLPAIEDFDKQQPIVRDALIALVDKIGPSILMTHSQGGAFGWPVADARPDKVKAILAIEPNGPPGPRRSNSSARRTTSRRASLR